MSSGGNHDTARPRRTSGRRRLVAVLGSIVLVCGLIVGYAHLRLHRLETADVAWSSPSVTGDTAIASGRVYTYDPNDGLSIHRMADGKPVSGEPVFGTWMYLGRSGYFAVLDLDQMTFYSPVGKKLWTRQLGKRDPVAVRPQAIGDRTVTFKDCTGTATCALVTLDADGSTVWRKSVDADAPFPYEHSEDVEQPATRNDRPSLRLVPSVPVQNIDGRLTALDGTGSPHGLSIEAKDAAIIGDTLVELSHQGDSCTYRAVRDGSELWTSSTACRGGSRFDREPLYVLAFSRRLYAIYSTSTGNSRMVSLDLTTGRATGFDYAYGSGDRTSSTYVYAGENVIVKKDKRRLTGISPSTGKVLWRYADHGGSELYPAVAVTGGTVNVLTAPRRMWRTLALGHTYPKHSITVLDARSGTTVAHFMHESIYGTTGAPDGALLVIADDRLFLVRRD
ncbi:PQQ-binding-like beta-propeller repeat protein [Aeromicrobium ginsengisoli]|uniref:PQQ-binding-like beta-propeller repeat protein n=1 Tax=Aeromicrobium ginsengisoli TaxID=363867 RepID=A0A5M4FHN1_9ACTN|nr:PQQ-binding-like beta-propeller repeat protein [Aeromicrobium ginsengisoli]KAA1399637.1 PQQ-binding-like beta-propeller repeat protein [Aeromicrobium ginsengisoli]